MMGAHHAACGAAAWIAISTQFDIPLTALQQIAPALPDQLVLGMGLIDVSPMGVLTGALVTAGAALLPDADHHNATIAHSLPPLSNALCRGLGKMSGGHRHGTHSIIGIVFFVLIAWLAGMWTLEVENFGTIFPGAGLLSVLLVAFAAKVLAIIPDTMQKCPWALGLATGAFIMFFAPQMQGWFPVAMGVGATVHILGDMLTTGGCNLIWPFAIKPPKFWRKIPVLSSIWRPNGNMALPLLGNAGSWREWLMLVPVAVYTVVAVGITLFGMGKTGLYALGSSVGLL
ncbi:metal-dependent hydrolase [Arthrobacter sp. 35W]|uniref:metal-dependent hydrolase n=1 Tax=Arthrobacter sp. 35W TaxID=1132441 RepID=UPI0003F55E6D|nr:metal-dependent hydrolase [Arthrobacter sp. 35W]